MDRSFTVITSPEALVCEASDTDSPAALWPRFAQAHSELLLVRRQGSLFGVTEPALRRSLAQARPLTVAQLPLKHLAVLSHRATMKEIAQELDAAGAEAVVLLDGERVVSVVLPLASAA